MYYDFSIGENVQGHFFEVSAGQIRAAKDHTR